MELRHRRCPSGVPPTEESRMEVSNPDKMLFPDIELTKAELVRHYETVGDLMLPFVADSPLTLERYRWRPGVQ